jgi:regulatory protein
MTLKRLRAKAIELLTRRDHSERELEDKLRSRGGEESDVERVVSDLRGIGLLDDRRFARNFLACRSSKCWGPRRYRQELLARGISGEIIDHVLSEVDAESEMWQGDGKLSFLVERELGRGREPHKVAASMMRRGFEYAQVKKAIRRESWDEPELLS